ncbi:MAG TPA: ThiF family adenylyltransferase [Stellaceae bacterium]|nr:ThiF family adenylyltransferase [Stellaceae bacterium]
MNEDIDRLADRHFRPDPQGLLASSASARTGRVLLGIAPGIAKSKAGQDALWMLANLLGRQFKLVTTIGLDIPSEIALAPCVAAFGAAPQLSESISNCVRLVAGTHVEVERYNAAARRSYDFEIVVGPPTTAARTPIRLVLFADGWRVYLGTVWPQLPDQLPSSGALGPYLGACFASGEVFKQLRGLKDGRGEFIDHMHPLFLSLWSGSSANGWAELEEGPAVSRLVLPPVYFAGAGAVGQSVALALASLPGVSGHVTAVDPETLDLTNDNRYVLATLDDDRAPKARFTADFLRGRGFTAFDHAGAWQSYVTGLGREPNRADLAAHERRYLYRYVLSCLDDNGARHAIQNLWPDVLIGGSTHGLTAKAIVYDMAGEQLCLKCFNPVHERNDAVRARLAEARSMAPDRRRKFFTDLGVDPDKTEQHLRDPGCGQLSESDLDRFAAGAPMMSVGFVSVAAGVLLAAQMLRVAFGERKLLTERGAILIANFYKPSLRWLRSMPEDQCDCRERRGTDWSARWKAEGAKSFQ